jgi:hypothetical protein
MDKPRGLWSARELKRPSDHRFLAKLAPTFADRGCCAVSTTAPISNISMSMHGVLLDKTYSGGKPKSRSWLSEISSHRISVPISPTKIVENSVPVAGLHLSITPLDCLLIKPAVWRL